MKPIFNPFTGGLQMINVDGSPGAGIVVKGAYAAGTDYAVGDSVDYGGSSYVMFVDAAAGTLPTNTTYWQVLANKGEAGTNGTNGTNGTDGIGITPQTVGFTLVGGTTPKTLTVALDGSVSGTNTGDQDLSGKVDVIAGKGLSTNDYTTAEQSKLSGIEASANNYSLPTAAAATLGGVKIGDRLSINTGVLSADVQTTDISGKVDKVTGSRLITSVESTLLGNTSGTNSGNQDLSGYAPLASPSLTGTPTAPTAGAGTSTTQLATTEFVQVAVRSSPGKEASEYATIVALPAIIYANGSSGVGATLTGVAVGALGVDSQSPAVGNRILVKNQVSTFQNGIYTVTATGSGIAVFVLTRALDFNQQTDILTGAATYVVGGTTLAATTWDVNSADSPVIGTDAITFVQSAGPGSMVAGNGITITGTSIAINTAVTADLTSTQSMTGKTVDGVTPTVMGYVDPTSSIQTQLNNKQASGAYLTTVDISANTNLAVSAPIVLTGDTLSIPAATASINGYATSTQITKLDGIAAGAEVNVNADWNSSSGDSQISNKPTLGTAAAKNIPATGDASATEVVYGSDTRLTNARTPSSTLTHAATHVTGSTDVIASAVAAGNAGLMTGTDKTKLDGITASATANAKISAATLDTGSDDTGFVTALSIASSHNIPHVVPSTAGKILTSDGTDWISATPGAGMVVQVVNTLYSAVASATTVFPYDDTVPQNTEGIEFMTQAITPKSATNVLIIEAVLMLSNSAAGGAFISAALFQDATTGALNATSVFQITPTGTVIVTLRHTMIADTTSATTFKIRAGGQAAGTTTFNGSSTNRYFGTIPKSSITITEIKI